MPGPTGPGILFVDKPGGMTSHDVVARTRRALGTRKVGHAGTLDPMATGLLVLGVESSTRLLTYLVGLGKTYEATIRLGQSTDSDDADGEITARADAAAVDALTDAGIESALDDLRGPISQVPSRVSAIKVGGRRAYDLVRAGEEVELAARNVTISRFDVLDAHRSPGLCDLDVVVDCSSGTYIRALARDLGAALGTGGHLTRLRRTHVGPFAVADAVDLDDIAPEALTDPATVASRVLGRMDVSDDEALALWQGKRLVGAAGRVTGRQAAAVTPEGVLVGVVERRGSDVKSAMNLPVPAASRTALDPAQEGAP